ncbi:MAG: carbon-nitrogen hydrolase family protein, partial [Candidatus Bathyarchaeia archaeon]
MTKLATVSMNVSLNDKKANLLKYERFVNEAARSEVHLIVFPECSYQGYHLWNLQHNQVMQQLDAERVKYFYESSETIPGPATERLGHLANENNMHIVFGMVERS